MNEILDRYAELLRQVDLWFGRCIQLHPEAITCRSGCSACCRGLFDITVMDALYLKRGVDAIEPELRGRIHQAADERLHALSQQFPAYIQPWFLDHLSDEECIEMMPEDDPAPCVLLSENGNCLVYDHRPMTCRLNGIPLFDSSGEAFSDEWCSLNFIDIDPEELLEIRYQFRELFYQEQLLFRELTALIYGEPLNEMDTIIPGAVVME